MASFSSSLRRSVARRLVAAGDADDHSDCDSADAPYHGHGDSTGSGSSSCSGGGSNSSASVPRWTDEHPCKFYPADANGCTRPRTCFDCLNVPVAGEECMVNEFARCVPKNGYRYSAWEDYRQFAPADEEPPRCDQRLHFPADGATYCDAASDAQCAACRASVFADVMSGAANESLTRYCYGARGCVCVALCEAPYWGSTIGAQVCHGAAPSTALDVARADAGLSGADGGGHSSPVRLVFQVVGAVAAVAVVAVVARFIRHRRQRLEGREEPTAGDSREGREGGDGATRRPRTEGPQLSLFGWQAMRSELVAREQLLLAGVEDFSDARTGFIQLLDVQASAPEEDEAWATAPVMIVPLAGASAPPMTPSAPSAPTFDDTSDMEDDDHDMAEL